MIEEMILATSNEGKIQELSALLAPIKCVSQAALGITAAVENGLSFIENALIKARYVSLQTHKPALADDSGLVVPALDGEPGILSARYSGANSNDLENMQLLLQKMQHIPLEKRKAWFYCAVVVVRHEKDPAPLIATGVCSGVIHLKPQGEGGFGYDPIFYLPAFQCTMAQLPVKIKNKISHRAQALKSLKQSHAFMQSL